MALLVEDGTGVAGANSYEEASAAAAYYTDMGYTDTATDAKMIRGSRTMDALYRHALKGVKVSADQPMVWPRTGVTDEDGHELEEDVIPELWLHAVYEMARIVPLNQGFSPGLFIEKVKAGSVEVDFQGGMASRQVFDFIQELVSPYVSEQDLVRA